MLLGEYPHSLFGFCHDSNGKLLKEVIPPRQTQPVFSGKNAISFCRGATPSEKLLGLRLRKMSQRYLISHDFNNGMRHEIHSDFGSFRSQKILRQGAVQLSWTHLKEIGTPIVGEYFCKCPGHKNGRMEMKGYEGPEGKEHMLS